MRVLIAFLLAVVAVLPLASCAPYTHEQRAEFIDIVTDKVEVKMVEAVTDWGAKLKDQMHAAITATAEKLELAKDTTAKLIDTLPKLINELAMKVVTEKAPAVVRKTMEDTLPEGRDSDSGGALGPILAMIVQAGLAAAKG